MKSKIILFFAVLLVVFTQLSFAQSGLTSSMLNKFEFRNLGAYRAGAWVSAIAVPENPGEKYKYTFFVAGRNGGVWKTVNSGTTFYPVFEKYGVTTIGAIAVAPSNPDVVWVGTGESYNARSSFAGNGIYKSVDGGETFTNMGLIDSHHIAKIIIDPKNADIVYIASMGHLYSTNAERGVFKTTDGGKTWEKVLFIDDKTGVIDMVMDPSNPSVLYASAYEKTRYPWHFEAGGKGSAVYKTVDGGKSWSKTLNGLPDGELGRIGLAISRSNPKIVYAVIENLNPKDPGKELKTEGMMNTSRDSYYDQLKGGEVYRSANGGQTWIKMNEEKYNVGTKAAYSFNQIFCNPQNPDNIWVLSDNMHISFDAGKTWTGFDGDSSHFLETMFGDHRTMWFDTRDGNHMLLGSDGGIYETFDAGKTTRHFYQIPIEEIYGVGFDFLTPYNIYVGLQDHDVWRGPSNGWTGEVGPEDWTVVGSGDGMYCKVDKETGRWIYSTGQFGQQLVLDAWTGKASRIMPVAAKGKPEYRYTWTTPLLLSPHSSSIVYTAAQMMLRTVNQGKTWEEISPDLTTNDPVKQNGRGHIKYCTITTFDESPLIPGILWAGTDDGKVQCTLDNGASWTDCTPALISAGCPAGFWTTRVTASAHDKATAYVSLSGYSKDDFRSLLFKTPDNGKTWKKITGNLPEQPINVITEDPDNKNLLFVGTDGGLYVTVNGGREWVKFEQIPAVPVKDIAIHPRENDLIVATYGRGVYIANIMPLKQMNDTVFASHAVLFPVNSKPLKNYSEAAMLGNRRLLGDTHLFTSNEPNAFEIFYYVNPDQFIAQKKKLLVLPTIELRNEADSLLKSFQIKESGFGKAEFPFRRLKTGKYSIFLKSNGKDYKQTAIITESWKWPVGNFDMQKGKLSLTKQTGKELYIPAKIFSVPDHNDFKNDTSEYCFKRMKESENIAVFWAKRFGNDPLANRDSTMRFSVDKILNEGERIYKYYVDSLKFVEKGNSISDKYKCLIFIIDSKNNTAFGGGEENKIGAFWATPARMSKAPFGALAHEMGHSFQYLSGVDKAKGDTTSKGGVGSYSFVEMTSQYMLWQVYPEWMTFENYHLVDFMKQTHLSFLHEKNMYHSAYVLEYWSNKHGIDFIGKLWREGKPGEDPVMTYKRLTSTDQVMFNDEIFDAARRFITWDMKRIEQVAKKYANQHFSKLDSIGNGWYKIDESKCPQNYGYNGIKLIVPKAGTVVTCNFKGIAGAEGYNAIKIEKAGWRYGFLAVKGDGSRVYGKMYSDSNGEAQFKVPKDTRFLWLVVSGAPTEHWIHTGGGANKKDEQWPYQIKLSGTSLDISAMK